MAISRVITKFQPIPRWEWDDYSNRFKEGKSVRNTKINKKRVELYSSLREADQTTLCEVPYHRFQIIRGIVKTHLIQQENLETGLFDIITKEHEDVDLCWCEFNHHHGLILLEGSGRRTDPFIKVIREILYPDYNTRLGGRSPIRGIHINIDYLQDLFESKQGYWFRGAKGQGTRYGFIGGDDIGENDEIKHVVESRGGQFSYLEGEMIYKGETIKIDISNYGRIRVRADWGIPYFFNFVNEIILPGILEGHLKDPNLADY